MANTRKAEVFTDNNGTKKVKIERKPSFPKIYILTDDCQKTEDGLYELDFFETPSVENFSSELNPTIPAINFKQLSEKGLDFIKNK
ncbi:hypothetical protein SAMN05421738_11478 [Algoriella xinjiangensis]|uniref:Uncharacterized protein n=1 Tax=Algoriella xinjiangensis TaxID=684065 RepID=A0A1I4ZV81_9FLAO|nr:hypothetical protein [Algoriella xinjiangensis]SFN54131.1 hypothetical protein SAMN05421738_11478 [Algoriella xinjiangensis]VDH16361.1 Uncharacterised protein [Algoriella xinjiangensis]